MRNGKHARTCLADGSAAGSGCDVLRDTRCVAVAGCEPLTLISVTEPTAQELMSPLKAVALCNMYCGAGGSRLQEPCGYAVSDTHRGCKRCGVWVRLRYRTLGAVAVAACEPLTPIPVTEPTAQELMSPLKEVAS